MHHFNTCLLQNVYLLRQEGRAESLGLVQASFTSPTTLQFEGATSSVQFYAAGMPAVVSSKTALNLLCRSLLLTVPWIHDINVP